MFGVEVCVSFFESAIVGGTGLLTQRIDAAVVGKCK